jgi:hypothetical protein
MMSKLSTKFIFSTLILALFTIISCTKEPEELPIPDVSFPVVSVTTPIKFSSQTAQAPVRVIGNVTDNNLKSLNLIVYNLLDSSIVLNVKPNVTGKKGYTFNESFGLNTSGNIVPCALVINAMDAANNTTLDYTNFVVN